MRLAIGSAALALFGCGAMPQELGPTTSTCATPIECGAKLFIGFQQYGANIGGSHSTSHESPAECCSLCGRTTGCKGFVWTNETQSTFSICFLKSTDARAIETPGECNVYGRMRDGTTTSTLPLTSPLTSLLPGPTTQPGLTTSLQPAPSPPDPTPVPTPEPPEPTPFPGLRCGKASECGSQIFAGMVELDGAQVDGTDASASDHASPTECCDYCTATAGCVAWLWTNGTNPPNLCYLKKELKSPQPSEECDVYGVLEGTNNQHGGPGIGGILAAVCGVLVLLLILVLLALWELKRRKEARETLDSFGETGLSRPLRAEVARAGIVVPQQSSQLPSAKVQTTVPISQPTSILKGNTADSAPQAISPPPKAPLLPSSGNAAAMVPQTSSSRRGSVDLATSLGAAREAVAEARAAAAASKVLAGADPPSLDPNYSERLREVQQMLDNADPDEIVGLAIQVYGEKAVVVEFVGDRFRAALDSGGEMMLEKIEAAHVVDWLEG